MSDQGRVPPSRRRWTWLTLLLVLLVPATTGCDKKAKDKGGTSAPAGEMTERDIQLAAQDAADGCNFHWAQKLAEGTPRMEFCLRYLNGEVKGTNGGKNRKLVNKNKNARRTYDYFTAKLGNRAQAAGVAGNCMGESGCTPDEDNPAAKSGGGGAFQWEGDRWSGPNGLNAFARGTGNFARGKQYYGQNHPGKWSNLDVQLDFVWWELHHTRKQAWEPLINSRTPEQAAENFCEQFEGPSIPHLDRRKAFARAIYNG